MEEVCVSSGQGVHRVGKWGDPTYGLGGGLLWISLPNWLVPEDLLSGPQIQPDIFSSQLKFSQ